MSLTENSPSQVRRFGAFEIDLQSGEVRKSGMRIKVQEQPLKVLEALLERPGEVVTREELRARIWPHETFGDFDHAVNIAVAKLRTALGDSAETPRFVETLHRRGYRFIAPVEERPAGVQKSPSHSAQFPVPPYTRSPKWLRWTIVAVVFGFAILLASVLRKPVSPRLGDAQQITRDGLPKSGVVASGLVTDGTRLYFQELKGSRPVAGQVSVGGGETAQISTPIEELFFLDISPDRSELLVANLRLGEFDPPLWIVPLPAGSPRRVGDLAAHDAAWLPDGRIVLANGSNLFVANKDGSESHKIVALKGLAFAPRVSPDGLHIRFSVQDFEKNSSSLWETTTDGKDLHPLLQDWNNPPQECCGKWTPDGEYYVFQSTQNGRSDLWALQEKSHFLQRRNTTPIRLTAGPLGYASPLPSLDGKKLFVVGQQFRGELVRYAAKIGQFVPYLPGVSATHVAVSRDLEWVAYVTYPEHVLWRSRVDGTERLQLTYPPTEAALPQWSPDGRQISFTDVQPGNRMRIFIVASEGGTPRPLGSGEYNELMPAWSPDGNRIAFGSLPWVEANPVAIHLMDLRTKQVSTIAGSEGFFQPCWSPDGRYLAAVGNFSSTLMLFDFSKNTWTEIAKGNVGTATWSHDSKYIYYNQYIINPGYFRVRVADRAVERIMDLKDFSFGMDLWGSWAGLTEDDSPLLLRDQSTQEIYAFRWLAR